MRTVKKPVSILLIFAMIISIMWTVPVTSAALNPARMPFEEFIIASLENFTERIDIGYYIRNNREWLAEGQREDGRPLASRLGDVVFPAIIDDNPQLFHVNARSNSTSWYSDFSKFEIIPVYTMTPAQYTEGLRRFNTATMQALSTIRHAETDFEKALLLHNYVVLNTDYDEELLSYYERHGFYVNPLRPLSHTAYGSLVDGLAVCDGYAKAYMHLLRLAGIESRIILGEAKAQFHAWNLVRIDGSWFHVDPTWNDPVGWLFGNIEYEYFLLTGSQIGRTHTNWRLPDGIRTDSTVFNNAFFRNANSAVVKLGDYFYWLEYTDSIERGVDNNFIKQHNIVTGRTETVHSFEAIWYVNGGEFEPSYSAWMFSNAGLAVYDGLLYFNSAKEILSFDPETGVTAAVHQPSNIGGAGNRFIFGMVMNENVITFSVKTEPKERDELFVTRVPFADAVETGSFTSADALAVLRYGAGLAGLTLEQRLTYDLNGDGVINTSDAIIILRMVAGISAINN
jgi:transglutaminase-like putative cysteine protease